MLKNSDIPKELIKFNSLFFKLQKFDISRVFDDFLTLIICTMGRGTQEELYLKTIKSYNRDEIEVFCRLFAELIVIYDTNISNEGICDPLGDYYECLASNYKKSNFGQFFTPFSICKIMSAFTNPSKNYGLKINEPCCGSGRMVLAANQNANGNYYICQDLDPICCKMTAINLCFHKINAEIHCMDTLNFSTPIFSISTNFEFWKNKTLSIFLYSN